MLGAAKFKTKLQSVVGDVNKLNASTRELQRSIDELDAAKADNELVNQQVNPGVKPGARLRLP